ncbi:MAG TPA: cation diffusion facilitator family transporter [Candidatus Dormibacteraeota bacterium]|nr:cation diffusion facilitator family transporter [Candidatus Dormibacteraeota bacterium]
MVHEAPRSRTPQLVALGSVAVDALLVLAKLTVGTLTGSLALISDAAHSGLDLVASAFALVAIRAASKPADREHPFGHGRAENLAAFCEGIALLVAATVIAFEGVGRLLSRGAPVDVTWYAIALPAATVVIESVRSTVLRRVARTYRSPALAANAQNRASDLLASVAVLIGLIAVRLGLHWADAAAALLVAVVIARSAVLLVWRSGDILIDRAPSDVEEAVARIIERVPGVKEIRSVRIRRSGAGLLGDARVATERLLSMEAAGELRNRIRTALADGYPDLDLTVVTEAQAREEQLVERVHAVAERVDAIHDLHNVTVELEQDGSLHLSMHAKLDGGLTLASATSASADLERRLREEFPGVWRIDVHLEPLEPDLVRGHDVTGGREDLAREVRQIVNSHPAVLGCEDVELSARGGRLVAHVVARMPADVTLDRAHEVETDLETRLRQRLPELQGVVARVIPEGAPVRPDPPPGPRC